MSVQKVLSLRDIQAILPSNKVLGSRISEENCLYTNGRSKELEEFIEKGTSGMDNQLETFAKSVLSELPLNHCCF